MNSTQRVLGVVVVVAMAVGSWTASADAATRPSPWLQSGYNAANTNANPLESTLTPGTAAGVKVLHTLAVDGGDNDCLGTGPGVALSDDYTYAAVGSKLTKYATSTGKVAWKVTTDTTDEDYFQVAISHGLAIVSGLECGTADPNGDIEAFSTATGKRVWFVDADGNGVSGVAVSGKYVVADSEADGEGDTPQFDVVDVQSGRTVWTTSAADSANLCDAQGGVIGGLVYETWCPGGSSAHPSLRALNLATGKTVWSRSGGYSVIRGDGDTVGAHHLYVRDGAGRVLDLNPKNGATRFTLSGASSVLAVDGTHAYAPCGHGVVCSYAVATGKRVWRAIDTKSAGSAIVGGSVLYLGDGLVLNAGNGHKITTYASAPSLVGNGRLVVVGADDTVTLLGR